MTVNENMSKFPTTQTGLNFLSIARGRSPKKPQATHLAAQAYKRELVPNTQTHIENQTSAYSISNFVTTGYYFCF